MACKICGETANVEYRARSGMFLCGHCHSFTPTKVGKDMFERVYWDGQADTVPTGIRQEFWEDYRASKHSSVKSYRESTTELV